MAIPVAAAHCVTSSLVISDAFAPLTRISTD
jgi:hypothetical protein